MSGFAAAWLDLREPADRRARDAGLLARFAEWVGERDAPPVVDLGSGTGSTLRAIGGVAPHAQWRLVDHDAALLAEARRRAPQVETRHADLAADLEGAVAGADAITASALIDLVSRDWLERLARVASGRAVYIALSVDGQDAFTPPSDGDDEVLAAFARDQARDKGFGPALGAAAAPVLAEMLGASHAVAMVPSPWLLEAGRDDALIAELTTGVADAAAAQGASTEALAAWRAARRERCRIGHLDLLALPRG